MLIIIFSAILIVYGLLTFLINCKNKFMYKLNHNKLLIDRDIFKLYDELENCKKELENLKPKTHYLIHPTLGVKYDSKTNLVFDFYFLSL